MLKHTLYRYLAPIGSVLLLFSSGTFAAEPTQQVTFQTDEGTWISLDISPDGEALIFELLGDIYRMPITGGKAEVLIAGRWFDSQPRYSPDGSQIVFVSDRSGEDNLWLADANGQNLRQLSTETSAELISPAWTADGSHILVSKISPRRSMSNPAELWQYPLATDDNASGPSKYELPPPGRNSLLVSSIPPGPFGAVATADGSAIYYASTEPRQHRTLAGPSAQIIRHDLHTGVTAAVSFEREAAFKPELSEDGNWLAFGARLAGKTGLRIRNLSSGAERWLVMPLQNDGLEGRATRDILPNFAFTPDSRSILIAYAGKIHRVDTATGLSQIVPFAADVSLDVTPRLHFPQTLEAGPVRARVLQGTALSPDGKRLAFSAFGDLYLMSVEGGNPQRISQQEAAGEFQPAWSPDGQSLVYVTWSGTEGGQIWRFDTNGKTPPQQLTPRSAFYRSPVWTPDGQQLLAITAPDDVRRINDRVQLGTAEQIIILPSAGGEPHPIGAAAGAARLHFGPQRDRFYSYSMATGLVSRRLDGSDQQSHLRVIRSSPDMPPAMAEDILISPGGSQALAAISTQLYSVQMADAPTDGSPVNVFAPGPRHKQLTTIGMDQFAWAEGGATITWTAGATVYTLPATTKPDNQQAEAGVVEIEAVVERPRRTPKGTLVLRGARAITMRGNEVINNADIVITDNRITAVGPRGSVKTPRGAKIIQLEGKTLMPGIVDIHAHWDTRRSILDTQDYSAYASLAFGVTTIRDPQSFDADIFIYSDLVATGEMIGPRIFSTGMGVFPFNQFKSYQEVYDMLSRYSGKYNTHLLKSYLVGNRQARQWVVEASRELGLMPTTEGGSDAKMDLTHAIDGFSGIEHTLPVTPFYKDVIELLAQTGITYTPTLLVAFGGPFARNDFMTREDPLNNKKLRHFIPATILYRQAAENIQWSAPQDRVYPSMARDANRLLQAGGHVGLGGHGELQGIQVHWEMLALASGGMSTHDVLRVATLESARAIGLENEIGSIETGKAADILVLDADPLADIRNSNSVNMVILNGVLYRADNLEEIWPETTLLPRSWWQPVPAN